VSETMLIEVDIDNEEFHLTLMDGSKWFVNPGDLPTVATWLPTSEITLEQNTDSMFDFDITNTSEGVTIKARQVA
jgi:hypothetical protein